MLLKTGIKGKGEVTVTAENTARAIGSGELEVFATPAMNALIEEAAWRSLAKYLEDGQTTVGISLRIDHTSATPIGMKVRCETELVEIDRRKLVFLVEVYDEAGKVGSGTHERFIVQTDAFMQKAQAKL